MLDKDKLLAHIHREIFVVSDPSVSEEYKGKKIALVELKEIIESGQFDK